MAGLFHTLLDILNPCRCASCGKTVSYSQNFLCSPCIDGIPPLPDVCAVCSVPLDGETCRICGNRAVYFDRHVTVSAYTGNIMRAVRNFKFRGLRRLAVPMGDLAAGELRSRGTSFDLVTCIPMSRKKKQARGYNQSELIGRHIARSFGKPFVHLLKEGRRSGVQKNLSLNDRFINAIDRYEVTGGPKAAGKRILIVDDVFTTGATLNECSRILKSAGSGAIYGITLAMTEINGIR